MPAIRLAGVTKTFGRDAEVLALDNVTLTVEQGQFVAIEGPSGSGKSTLLNIVAILDLPSSGSYLLDGEPLGGLDEAARARLRSDLFGFVFQSFHLMPRRSALENVEVGLLYRGVPREVRAQRSRQALERVGLAHRIDSPTGNLSGGECQRVAIARALVADPPIIVADEPTGNLDSVNSGLVLRDLSAAVADGATVILVTHDSSVANAAPIRVRVFDGRVSTGTEEHAGAEGVLGRSGIPTQASAPAEGETPGKGSGSSVAYGVASSVSLLDLTREARRALTSRPARSAFLVAAVALALGLIVATFGLSESASSQVSERFDARRNRDVSIDVPLTFGSSGVRADLTGDYEARLRALAGVSGVGLVEQRGRVAVQSGTTAAPVPDLDLLDASGGALTTLDTSVAWAPGHPRKLGPGEVLVGQGAARAIGLGPVALDPEVTLSGHPFTAVGVITSSRRLPALVNGVVLSETAGPHVQALQSATVYVSVLSGAGPQIARQAPVALDPYTPERYETHAPADPRSLRDQIQGDVRSTLVVLSVLAALASTLGVANAMMLGVLERVGELGLRRAIGARPVHVFAQTGLEALIVGAVGGVVGLLGGLGVVLGVTIARGWTPVFDLRLAPAALVGGLLVGSLGGSAAAFRASRVQPADALRR